MRQTLPSLGGIFQLGYVVEDLERAVAYWTQSLGVGPFFTMPRVEEFLTAADYYGKPSDIRFSATIGYWDDRQIELIVPTNDAPSIYRDWLQSGRQGLHHIGVAVDDIEPGRRMLVEAGGVVAQELTIAGGAAALYVDLGEDAPVRYVEHYHLVPDHVAMYAQFQAAAENWDGKDPLRMVG